MAKLSLSAIENVHFDSPLRTGLGLVWGAVVTPVERDRAFQAGKPPGFFSARAF